MTVGAVTLIGCLVLLVRMMLAPEGDPLFADLEQGGEDGSAPHGLWATLAWFAFLLVLSSLLGLVLALAIFFVAFLRMRAGVSWARTLVECLRRHTGRFALLARRRGGHTRPRLPAGAPAGIRQAPLATDLT